MALTRSGPDYGDTTGTTEVITIQPVAPQTSTLVTFVAGTYGLNADGTPRPLPGTVAGKTSLTFDVLQGFHKLVFGLASPAAQLQSVNIMQGTTLLSTVSVDFHSGTATLRIMGNSAVPVAEGAKG